MIRKFLGEICILGVRGNLSQGSEHRNIIKVKTTSKIISPALFQTIESKFGLHVILNAESVMGHVIHRNMPHCHRSKGKPLLR